MDRINRLDILVYFFALAWMSFLVYGIYRSNRVLRREKKKFMDEKQAASQSREFALIKEIAEFFGRKIFTIEKPLGAFKYSWRRIYSANRDVYDARQGGLIKKPIHVVVEQATFVDGDPLIIKLYKQVLAREPQAAIDLLKELHSIPLTAIAQLGYSSQENSRRTELLHNKFREFSQKILDLCVNHTVDTTHNSAGRKDNVYALPRSG